MLKITLYKRDIGLLFYIFMLLPFIFPTGARQFYGLGGLLNLWQTVAEIIIILIYVFKMGVYLKQSKFVLAPLVFSIILVGTTIAKQGDNQRSVEYALEFITVFLIADICIKEYGKRFLYVLSVIACIIAFINAIMLIIDPEYFGTEGTYRRYCFISNDNSLTPFLLPGMIIALMAIELHNPNHKRLWNIIVCALFSSSIYLTWTGTGVVLFTFIFAVFLLKRIGIWKLFDIKNTIILSIVSVFLFTQFQVQNYFSVLFGIVQKDITFSNRTVLWGLALEKIKDSIILGYGMTESDLMFSLGSLRDFTAHNQYLQILLWGGIVLLFSYLCIIYVAYRPSNINKIDNSNIRLLALLGIFGLMYYYVFEVHNTAPMAWIMFSIVANYKSLCNNVCEIDSIELLNGEYV